MKNMGVFRDISRFFLFFLVLAGFGGCQPVSRETSPPTPVPNAEPAAAFALPSGWREHTTERFVLALPADWEAADIDSQGVDAIMNSLKVLKAEWAKSMAQTISSEAFRESLRFWARGNRPAGVGYANVNVTYQSSPFPPKISDLCAQISSAYTQMHMNVVEKICDTQISGLDAARFTVELPVGAFVIKQYQFIFVQNRNMWVLTLSVDATEWAQYQPIFETVAKSFRVIR